jgi:hypothetical protein
MNDQSAIRAHRTSPENLRKNSLAVLISVGHHSFREQIDNVEAFGVPHNCQHHF